MTRGMTWLDDMLRARQFEALDELLRGLDLGARSTVVLIGILSITHPAADKLPGRATWGREIVRIIHERDLAREVELLRGLWDAGKDGAR